MVFFGKLMFVRKMVDDESVVEDDLFELLEYVFFELLKWVLCVWY